MREIKFRAWDKEARVMYYEVQSVYDAPYIPAKTADGEDAELGCYYNSFGGILRDDDMVVMQYTGLKDKNGKEIYEGDIVTSTDRTLPTNVSYETPMVGYFPMCNYGSRTEWEVIGNIHENPELLKN